MAEWLGSGLQHHLQRFESARHLKSSFVSHEGFFYTFFLRKHFNEFKGKTTERHELALELKPGEYLITVTDDFGNEIRRRIEIQGK